jgi:GMP synthase-like glutamine amidotransferase
MRVLVMADRTDSDPGYVGERLEQRGGVLTLSYRDRLADDGAPALGDVDLVLLLGSHHGVAEPGREAYVEAESALVRTAVDTAVPVIGICYGAQLSAHALGGSVGKAPESEIGWYYVESHDPALCPPGPWVEYHEDAFSLPPCARSLGQTDAGPQGFVFDGADGPAVVSWQFHPEVTPQILQRWVSEGADDLRRRGYDGPAMVTEAYATERFSRAAAHALVDIALDVLALRTADPAREPAGARGRMDA